MEAKDKEAKEESLVRDKMFAFLKQTNDKTLQELLDQAVKYLENGGDPEKLKSLLSKK